ncbi:hypothetical protein B0T24DRAFT_227306 [Lasiosphaeria ovina]|uniref:Uncharacterized protein n=1 Tax=Lasiosphaeria ovina TaxID=92902 RepID=A0AAE0KIR6_9PEZI|nr:hypothetical protein B0T24DRAFT_227306 [Lasiosphaeria ovina]
MASPDVAAVAALQVNGVAVLSRPDSPSSINSSTKRKRDSSDSSPQVNGADAAKAQVNGAHSLSDQQPLIRDFFDVLKSLDSSDLGILSRPLPDSLSDGEPAAKRAKSEDSSKPLTITDKTLQGAYSALDELVSDVSQVVNAQVRDLEVASRPEVDDTKTENAIAKAVAFKSKATDLARREMAYPNVPKALPPKINPREPLPLSSNGGLVLTTVGAAPTLKPLFTSLQHAATPDGVLKSIPDALLPNGVTTTQILPDGPASTEKNNRPLTLGELFPSPRNLPPLQPPKVPKTTTKSTVLTFYHPELTEKSKYRTGTYFSQTISTGNWLDYSNATPTAHVKTKQRERAQSLAGHKPSSTELEMSEMEALFRGAFSSFAPCKDDSAAIVPSSQVSRIWWQRVGRRNFDKILDSDAAEDENEDGPVSDSVLAMEIDEEQVKAAIEEWDDNAIDPSLDHVLGKKSDEDKEIDDLLEEVSDLIETLASYQRNRNLTLPTSQDRYSADPVNGDMLRNGSLSHQPSEEEMMTYQTLKSQLSLIIRTLPPYAVARLNSDKLEELSVSTKIEVRTDEYRGVMEEDEPARLARQAAQAAASNSQRQAHRAPSVSATTPYATHQFPTQFATAARPIANAQHYPQTPSRPQPMFQPRQPSTVPIPQPHHQPQQRPPPQNQYRPQNSYGFTPQLAKAQTPYGHTGMPQYASSPTTQPRMSPHPGYNQGQAGNHSPRYPPGYPGGYPQQQPQIHHPQHQPQPQPQHQQLGQHPPHPQHQQHLHPQHQPHPQHQQLQQHQQPPQHQQLPQHQQHLPHIQHSPHHPPLAQHAQHAQHLPQQPPYSPYANGGHGARTISPQVQQVNAYGQSPTPPPQHQQLARSPYGGQMHGMPPNPAQRQYPGTQPGMMPGQGGRPAGLVGYATVMPEVQQRQVMEQARARADAEQRVSGHMGKVTQGEVVGLAGIGLGGNVDVHKIAAAKAMHMGNNMSPSPKMPIHGGPSPVNGAMNIPPPARSPLSAHPNIASPMSGPGFKPPM